MNYQIYRMEFPSGIHLGKTSLDTGLNTFCADTLFSTLCMEALKFGEGEFSWIVESVKAGSLLLSDAFPYVGKTFYVPKPHLFIERENGEQPDKKAMKKLSYIPIDGFDNYLDGRLDVIQAERDLSGLGRFSSRTSAAVRGNGETLPYRVGTYRFSEGCGLYIIVAFEDLGICEKFEYLMESLQYSGIGGRRTEGLGQFTLYKEKTFPDVLKTRLLAESGRYMSLSVGLPRESEIDCSMNNAEYRLIKRSGFVASETFSDSYQRKRDLFVFAAGSCFKNRFEGDIYDVKGFGNHPVYRYAKPIFMGVDQ